MPSRKPLMPFLPTQPSNSSGLRIIDAQRSAVALLYPLNQIIGFGEQAAGIDGEDLDLGDSRPDKIGKDHGLRAQTIGIAYVFVFRDRGAKQRNTVLGSFTQALSTIQTLEVLPLERNDRQTIEPADPGRNELSLLRTCVFVLAPGPDPIVAE